MLNEKKKYKMCICLLRECKLVVIKCFPKHLIGFKISSGQRTIDIYNKHFAVWWH